MAVRRHRNQVDFFRLRHFQNLFRRIPEGEARLDGHPRFAPQTRRRFLEPFPVFTHFFRIGKVELIKIPRHPSIGDMHEEQLAFRDRGKFRDVREQRVISIGMIESNKDPSIHG